MLGFSEEIAIKVWKGTEDGVKAEALVNDLHITNRTVERLREVRNGFSEDKADSELVTKAWNLGSIKTLHKWWQDYQISKNPDLHRRHIKRLIKLASEFRNRIMNPEIGKFTYTGASIWKWRGEDWRFTPVAWECMIAPYLGDEELLKSDLPGFQYLKKHIEHNPFWSHHENFGIIAGLLKRDIDVAIEKAGIKNDSDFSVFEEYRDYLESLKEEGAWSLRYEPKQGEASLLNPDEMAFLEEKFQILVKIVPEYQERLNQLENLLQQMWDDFDPEEIEPEIELGRCPKCFLDIYQEIKE